MTLVNVSQSPESDWLNKMKETESAQNSEEVINNIDKLLNQIKDFSQFVYEWSAGKIDMSV